MITPSGHPRHREPPGQPAVIRTSGGMRPRSAAMRVRADGLYDAPL